MYKSDIIQFTIFLLILFESDPCIFPNFAKQLNIKQDNTVNIIQKKEIKTFIYSKDKCIINHQRNTMTDNNTGGGMS